MTDVRAHEETAGGRRAAEWRAVFKALTSALPHFTGSHQPGALRMSLSIGGAIC